MFGRVTDSNETAYEIAEFRQAVAQAGFTPTSGSDSRSEYFTSSYVFSGNRNVEVIVRLIVPSSTAKESYTDALVNDEVVIYAGHARYGTGPDFDDIDNPEEQFIIGANSAGHSSGAYTPAYNEHMRSVVSGQGNDLERLSSEGAFQADKYQVWVFGACSTDDYVDEIRGGLVAGKDSSNLDIIGTTTPILLRDEGNATLMFIEGLLRQQSISSLVDELSANTESTNDRACNWFEDGCFDNPTSPTA